MSDPFWADARARMLLDPTATNLNTGSFGPVPRPVFDRATELRRRLAAEPMDFLVRQMPPLRVRVKKVPPQSWFLTSRGFHWVNEFPLNR